jgi:hypothetical protein
MKNTEKTVNDEQTKNGSQKKPDRERSGFAAGWASFDELNAECEAAIRRASLVIGSTDRS